MKVLYPFLIMVSAIMIISLSMPSSTSDELVYAQQEENQTDFIEIQEEVKLTLGKSIYI